jgi:NAD(P)-dependent dehydrogenase (short-subunit alcohol dehydrogenase family)
MRLLITGANRGIGRALWDELQGRGHDVTGTHRGAATGATLSLDVTNPASVAAFAETMRSATLDGLICNAGVYTDKGKDLSDITAHDWAETMAVNVTGVFLTIQACLPALHRGSDSRIAIIGSTMGSTTRAPGGSYVYRASKAAVLNLGRNLATDLRTSGITVQVINPGWIRTDMGGDEADLSLDEAAPQIADRIEAMQLSGTGAFLSYDGNAHDI